MSEKIAEIIEAKKKADAKFEFITKDYRQADEWIEVLLSEIDRITTERDKAIEGLKWYGNAENYTYQFYYGDIDNGELEEPIKADDGERARTILKELGADVDWTDATTAATTDQ